MVRAWVPGSVRASEWVQALTLVSARALALVQEKEMEKEMGRDWNYQSRNMKR